MTTQELIFKKSNRAIKLQRFIYSVVVLYYGSLLWDYIEGPTSNWHRIKFFLWTLSLIFIIVRKITRPVKPYLQLNNNSLIISDPIDIVHGDGFTTVPLPHSDDNLLEIPVQNIQSLEINQNSSYLYFKNSKGTSDGLTLEITFNDSKKLGDELKTHGIPLKDLTN